MSDLKKNLMIEMSPLIYLKEVLDQTPRLLSLLDRNTLSKTYGCFDRQYWHYKVLDFPCARLQEAVLTLALLYKIDHKENFYYNDKLILEWINAALKFWTKIQEKNGSFNEWYPMESSFVATSFSTYAISEVLIQLDNKIKERDKIISSLKKAADFILKRNEKRAMNQESGAIISLYNIFLLTDEERYKNSAEEKVNLLIKEQNDEGWFPEYGGADIGYLSLTIDYLAKYWKKTDDERILEILKKAADFITYFVHPNLTFGGEYGSRNTSYLIPDGFEILSDKIPNAALISDCIRKALKARKTISPSSFDDRYLAYVSYTYLQAYLNYKDINLKNRLPYQKEFTKDFSQAGFWIYSNKKIYLIANYKKGGTVRAFFEDNAGVYDSGIMLKTKDGDRLTSSWLTDKNDFKVSKDKIKISGNLCKISDRYLSPEKSVMLRTFQITLGRNENIALGIKEKFRDKLITDTKMVNMKFSREIEIYESLLKIKDKIDFPNRIKELVIGGNAAHIYTPSSRYFQNSDLSAVPIILKEEDLSKYRDLDKLEIVRNYDMHGRLIEHIIER